MAVKAAVKDESYMVVLNKKKKHAYALANNLLSAGGPADMMAAVAYVIMTRSGHKARLDRAAAATMKTFHEVARLDAEAVRFPRLAAWKVAHGAKQAHSCRWRGCMRKVAGPTNVPPSGTAGSLDSRLDHGTSGPCQERATRVSARLIGSSGWCASPVIPRHANSAATSTSSVRSDDRHNTVISSSLMTTSGAAVPGAPPARVVAATWPSFQRGMS